MFYLQVINVNIPVQQHGPSDYRLLCISTIFSNKHVMHTYNCYVIITVSINWLPLLCPPADISMCIHREVSQPLKQLSYSIVKHRPRWSEFAIQNHTRADRQILQLYKRSVSALLVVLFSDSPSIWLVVGNSMLLYVVLYSPAIIRSHKKCYLSITMSE